VARVANFARPGELLKGDGETRRPSYLAKIRLLPCVNCGQEPCGEAAHLRYVQHPGIGRKPSDKWATPLCHDCHMSQHSRGERIWWEQVCGVDPVRLAKNLWKAQMVFEKMREITILAFVTKRPTRPALYSKPEQ
jgi:hypothetical protein